MNYANALTFVMEVRRKTVDVLAKQMYVKTDWINKILKNPNWKPCLDTILHICYCLEIDVFGFLKISDENTFRDFCVSSATCLMQNTKQRYIILNLTPKHISKTLRFFRKAEKITQTTLSERTKFQLSAISLRESLRYASIPTMETIQLYCKAFNISLEVFIRKVFAFVDFDTLNISYAGNAYTVFNGTT